ncbi:MAG TPA: amidohydrolase family protein [Burkholderiaceae bacterium]|nr:amidohydrolase family protein [Burkholderiaceae bacterium]
MAAPGTGPVPTTGLVDSHFHVIGPPSRFPMAADRSYTPAPASLEGWRATLGPLGVTRGVVVQPSFYGTDNHALLDAVAQGDGDLAGVAAFDETVSDRDLAALAAQGVRGVRMAYFEPGDPRSRGGFVAFAAFDALEARLRAHAMHLNLFTDSRLLPVIAARLRRATVPVVIDHMGRTPAHLGLGHAGATVLTQLLAEGRVWVKLSGVANISEAAPAYEDARTVHDALLAANPERLLWGSDWPHTRPGGTAPDTAALLQLFFDWTPRRDDRERILLRNPAALYRFEARVDSANSTNTQEMT